MDGVMTKRIYLIEQEVEHAPSWLEPFLKYGLVLRLYREHCIRKVNRMTVGEVLAKYYEVTK